MSSVIRRSIIADKLMRGCDARSLYGDQRNFFHTQYLDTELSYQRVDGRVYNDFLYMRRDCNLYYSPSMDMDSGLCYCVR